MTMFKPEDLRDELIGHNPTRRSVVEVAVSKGIDVGAKLKEFRTRGSVENVLGAVAETIYDVRRMMW
jgi:hypothetical protein